MVYRTMQGKEIDMDKLMRQNELVPAIGNMKINARGDEIGAGGKIVRKREEVVQHIMRKIQMLVVQDLSLHNLLR